MADRLDLQYQNYLRSGINSHYAQNLGLLVIPVMGPSGTAPAVVRVSAAYGTREVDFEYTKKGMPPLFPNQSDTNSGDTLLSTELEMPAPIPSPEGGLIYGVRGHYSYVQPGDGRGRDEKFPIDAHPFVTYIDTLGEEQPAMSSPDDLVTYGQWSKDNIDTAILTSTKIIG